MIKKPWPTVALLGGLLAGHLSYATSVAAEVILGPAESKLQIAQISALLAGQYDNEPQRHYLDGMKRGATAPARLHVEIRPVPDAQATFTLEERDGGEHDAITRRGTLTLQADAVTRQVVMKLADDTTPCEWQWSKRNNVWMATPRGACVDAKGTSRGVGGKTLWLGPDELWLEAAGEPVISELGRARTFDCYIAFRQRDSKPQVFTGLRVHDRGGTIDVLTDEQPARKLTLTLRRGMWPSNSGNNLVELLSLYLREEAQPAILGSGWATPDSTRVGFGTEEEGLKGGKSWNSRCKRIE
jgi:hypothetical protein